MKIRTLPNSVTVQYSELMQNCIHPLSDGSNISFKSKTINGRRYWYLYISLGSSRREHYLGQETTELLDQIDAEKSMWESDDDDRELRKTLVKMLVAGGMTAPTRNEGKLLALLERSGVFLADAVLIGTTAFKAYGNMLGVRWASELATQDIDIAADSKYRLALPRTKQAINLGQVILDSGMGFFQVPALNRKQASTSFKIRSKDLIQAELVFQVLLETRPGDIALAFDAAKARGEKFVDDFLIGLGLIGEGIQEAVRSKIEAA